MFEDFRVQIYRNNVLEDDFQAGSHSQALAMAYYYCQNKKQDLKIIITSALGAKANFSFIASKFQFI